MDSTIPTSLIIAIAFVFLCIISALCYVLRSKCTKRKRSPKTMDMDADAEQGQVGPASPSPKISSSSKSSSIEEIQVFNFPLLESSASESSSSFISNSNANRSRDRSMSTSSTKSKTKYKSTPAIPVPPSKHKIYAEIPVMVEPLTPPRAVVLVQDIDNCFTAQEKFDAFMMEVRMIQQSLKTESTASLKCNLVIAAHASSERIAGYCVNLKEKTCQMYTYGSDVLPWEIQDPEDKVELGAKNLLFALLLWDKEIVKAKRVRLYVGNEEVILDKTYHDVRMSKVLIKHYQNCAKVTWVNENDFSVTGDLSASESELDERDFYHEEQIWTEEPDLSDLFRMKRTEVQKLAKFVQPVVDLSFWRISKCEKHIRNMYDIDRDQIFQTHYQGKWNKSIGRPWTETTNAYDEFLERIQGSLENWHQPCPNCGVDISSSSTSINHVG